MVTKKGHMARLVAKFRPNVPVSICFFASGTVVLAVLAVLAAAVCCAIWPRTRPSQVLRHTLTSVAGNQEMDRRCVIPRFGLRYHPSVTTAVVREISSQVFALFFTCMGAVVSCANRCSLSKVLCGVG